MPDYTKSIIYKIVCKDLSITDCYVGSTTNFNNRKSCHKAKHNNPNCREYNSKVYKFIRENGYWDNWDMIMIEEFPCDNKLQLHRREREIIETLKPTLNSEIPSRTNKQYKLDNKEKIKQQMKQYREDNIEKIKQYEKQYREDNKEKSKEKSKEYYEKNKEKIGCRICKCMVVKKKFIRHTKSKKHIDNLSVFDQK